MQIPEALSRSTFAKPLSVAADAAGKGGAVLMNYLRDGVEIRNKSDSGGKSYDLVGDADLDSERIIAKTILEAFPDHALLGEEELTADVTSPNLWIIDPLDGTNNFAHGVQHFAVSIAYYQRGVAMAAAVLNPARDDLFLAVRGGGAFHNGKAIKVDAMSGLGESLIGCGFYYDRGAMMRCTLSAINEFFQHDIHGIRRFGTASLDLCQVACGQLGGFFEYKLSPWDFAAGALIIEEAGGRLTTALGEATPLTATCIVASNSKLHDAMLQITRKHHPANQAEPTRMS